MKTILAGLTGLLAFSPLFAQIPDPLVYFKQDFCNPNLQFESAAPDIGQVDHVIATSPATATLGSCFFDATRTVTSEGGSVRIVRKTALASPAPQTLHALIDMDVRDITHESSIAGYFGFGTNLPSNSILIPNAQLFSKLSIDFGPGGTYNLRISNAGGTPTLSEPLSGRIKIVWAMNNSSEIFTYFSPLKTGVDLAPGRFDVWINETRWIAGATRISDVPLENFAFILSSGVGKVRIHHLEISSNGFQLPLILTRFAAERRLMESVLYWEMAEGHTAQRFSIEKSTTGKSFEAIGHVDVPYTKQLRYQFEDKHPNHGHNYYRLKMIGNDGEIKYSPIRMVYFDLDEPTLTLAPNPSLPDKITMLAMGIEVENIALQTLMGQKISFSHQYDKESRRLTLRPSSPLPSGIYLLTVRGSGPLKNYKVIIP